jgi:hypothetical protein
MKLSDETPLPHSAPAARLIVCERAGQWSAALRVELAESGVRVWECRRLAEAWSALAETPGAFVIAEVTQENVAELLERLSWLGRDFPFARAAAVADRGFAQYEWLVREAGAVHFMTSPRRLAPLAGIVLRHLANVPVPEQPLVDRIWATLPWPPRGG